MLLRGILYIRNRLVLRHTTRSIGRHRVVTDRVRWPFPNAVLICVDEAMFVLSVKP